MTQALMDAAQALLDACDRSPTTVQLIAGIEGLRAALSAPQPAADERVAELVRLVHAYTAMIQPSLLGVLVGPKGSELQKMALAEFEQSARTLLSASQEDAEHAAMYRWLREKGGGSWSIYPEGRPKDAVRATGVHFDAAVKAAMLPPDGIHRYTARGGYDVALRALLMCGSGVQPAAGAHIDFSQPQWVGSPRVGIIRIGTPNVDGADCIVRNGAAGIQIFEDVAEYESWLRAAMQEKKA